MNVYEQLFSDEANFADNLEITVGDKKFTLGEARELSKKKQGELAAKLNEAKDLATKAAGVIQEYEGKKAAIDAAPVVRATADDKWDEDPLFRPVAKKTKELETMIGDLKKQNDTLTNALGNTAKIWFRDRAEAQFDRSAERLKKSAKYKDYDVDKVLEFASQNKIFDGNGLPSVARAIQELTKEDDIAIIRREEYERGLKEGATKGRMAGMTRPTSAEGAQRRPEDSAVGKNVSLEHLGDDVSKDPELMEMLSQLGAADPGDFVQ